MFWCCHTGGEEEDKDGCSEEEMDVSHPDLLSIAGIRSNNASSAFNDAEESSVQQSQGVNNRGCEGDNGKEKPLCILLGGEDLPVGDRDGNKEDDHAFPQEKMDLDILQHDLPSGCEGENGKKKPWRHLPGGEGLPVGDRDKNKGDDQAFPQEKMDLDISQPALLNNTRNSNNVASSALRDNSKEDDMEGCCQAKFEVENTGQCHGPSGGVDSSADSAKVSLTKE